MYLTDVANWTNLTDPTLGRRKLKAMADGNADSPLVTPLICSLYPFPHSVVVRLARLAWFHTRSSSRLAKCLMQLHEWS